MVACPDCNFKVPQTNLELLAKYARTIYAPKTQPPSAPDHEATPAAETAVARQDGAGMLLSQNQLGAASAGQSLTAEPVLEVS